MQWWEYAGTKPHLTFYWHIPTKVGFCHDGNLPACHDDGGDDDDDEEEEEYDGDGDEGEADDWGQHGQAIFTDTFLWLRSTINSLNVMFRV